MERNGQIKERKSVKNKKVFGVFYLSNAMPQIMIMMMGLEGKKGP